MISFFDEQETAQTDWTITALRHIISHFDLEKRCTHDRDVKIEVSVARTKREKIYFSDKLITIALEKDRDYTDESRNRLLLSSDLTQKESLALLISLTHDLLHCIDNNESGNGGFFATMAKRCGLLPPYNLRDKAHSEPKLIEFLKSILEELGDYAPYVSRASGAYLNVRCTDADCMLNFRTSRKQLDHFKLFNCPICGRHDGLIIHGESQTLATHALSRAMRKGA